MMDGPQQTAHAGCNRYGAGSAGGSQVKNPFFLFLSGEPARQTKDRQQGSNRENAHIVVFKSNVG
jgi:hypothetical protein